MCRAWWWTLLLLASFATVAFCAGSVKPFTNDQCPDLFKQPLEYRSIVQFRVVPNKSHSNHQCVVMTQCSVDRLNNLERLARAWDGAISAAVYISTASPAIQAESTKKIEEFATKMTEDNTYHGLLLISVLFGHEDSPWRYDCPKAQKPPFPLYPINNLRNLAVIGSGGPKGAPFPLFFLLDVDFVPSVGLRTWVESHANVGLIARCHRGDLIVIPAFDSTAPMPNPTVPNLFAGIENGTVEQFHWKRHVDGHKATNYAKYVPCTFLFCYITLCVRTVT
jgi:glycosyltransferase-like protein LARGE